MFIIFCKLCGGVACFWALVVFVFWGIQQIAEFVNNTDIQWAWVVSKIENAKADKKYTLVKTKKLNELQGLTGTAIEYIRNKGIRKKLVNQFNDIRRDLR